MVNLETQDKILAEFAAWDAEAAGLSWESLHDDPSFDLLESQLAASVASVRGLGMTAFRPPNGRVGNGYSYTLTTWGGQPPFNFFVSVGSLPPGLTLNAGTGVISGTPTEAGSFYAEIAVQDSSIGRHSGQPQKMVVEYSFLINP